MAKLTVVKIGGKIINEADKLDAFMVQFAQLSEPKILVHGGGHSASETLNAMGIAPLMHEGRRITDARTLKVVVSQYAGLINKTIVAKLQAIGVNSLGLSGADGNIILAHKRVVKTIDYGFAGDVDKVDGEKLMSLINLGFTPVICPVTHDQKGQLLNTNADTVATEIAIELASMCEVSLRYCFEYDGVLKDLESREVIPLIDQKNIEKLTRQGVLTEGMIPKISNAVHAINSGVTEVAICGVENLPGLKNATIIM